MLIRPKRRAPAQWLTALALSTASVTLGSVTLGAGLEGAGQPAEAHRAEGEAQEPDGGGLIERDGLTIRAMRVARAEGVWSARGDVRVASGALLILCEAATFDEAAARVVLEGRVRLHRGQERLEGERAVLDQAAGTIQIEGARGLIGLPALKAPAKGSRGQDNTTTLGSSKRQ